MELASWIQSRRIAYARRKNGNRWKDENIQDDRVNGNGHTVPKGAIDERAQVLVDRASERVEGTLTTRRTSRFSDDVLGFFREFFCPVYMHDQLLNFHPIVFLGGSQTRGNKL